jgi:membrane-bound metal-dependent hydrolase YbcI (DUF457 family)
MDIVTHGITGVLVSRAFPSGDKGSMMMAGLIGALAPDLDVIAGLWDPMAAITVHRTATHSFLGGVVIAAVVAGLLWSFRRESFFRLFGFAYLGLLSHIGSDFLTSFGIAILWPLSDRRFALAQHYIIDPLLSILAVAFLIASFRLKGKETLLAKIGIAGILLYVFITAAHQRVVSARWQGIMESQGIRPIRSAVIPLFPGPFHWQGISETEEALYQQDFWLYGSDARPPRKFSKTKVDLGYVERLREVQLFLDFARFPWRQVRIDGPFRIVEYRELAFADHPLGILGGPLSLRIWLDEVGSVRQIKFGHRF